MYEATTTDGAPLKVVGRVQAFPRHPAPGTTVEPFDQKPPAELDSDPYALVTVDWATEYKSFDPDTGDLSTEYRRGGFGTPTGQTWYLTPAQFDTATGIYRTDSRQMARGFRDARLSAELVALGAPEEVPIHDHVLT